MSDDRLVDNNAAGLQVTGPELVYSFFLQTYPDPNTKHVYLLLGSFHICISVLVLNDHMPPEYD